MAWDLKRPTDTAPTVWTSPGAFGWGGAYGTLYRVDPQARLVMVLMIQLMPNRTDIRTTFPNLVYQALMESPDTRLEFAH